MTTTPPAATIGRAPHTFPTARRLTTRLAAPAPGWTLSGDVIVVGSGIAGLATAIHAHRAGHRVLVVTKSLVNAGSTAWAQGGIAAALADDDSPAEHRVDTLVAGAGLCDEDAVRAEHERIFGGPERIDVPMTRVRVPMPTQSGVPLMAQNDDPPYPRITPRKELDDPYA